MRSPVRSEYLLISLFVAGGILSGTTTRASSGISVSPAVVSVDLATGSPLVELTYQNTTDRPVEIELSAQDFSNLEEGWRVRFLDQGVARSYRYGLSSWISFETDRFTLTPKETRVIRVFIDGNGLSPGGHYASVQASFAHGAGSQGVGIRGVLSILVFVRTATGREIEAGDVRALTPQRRWLGSPRSFLLRFRNDGNVPVVPHGLLVIRDPLRREVARGILNEDASLVLPETLRNYALSLRRQALILVPGFYHARLTGAFGKTDHSLTADLRFFVLTPAGTGVLLLVLITAGAGLWWSRTRRRATSARLPGKVV